MAVRGVTQVASNASSVTAVMGPADENGPLPSVVMAADPTPLHGWSVRRAERIRRPARADTWCGRCANRRTAPRTYRVRVGPGLPGAAAGRRLGGASGRGPAARRPGRHGRRAWPAVAERAMAGGEPLRRAGGAGDARRGQREGSQPSMKNTSGARRRSGRGEATPRSGHAAPDRRPSPQPVPRWCSDPSTARGRLPSSPWHSRIRQRRSRSSRRDTDQHRDGARHPRDARWRWTASRPRPAPPTCGTTRPRRRRHVAALLRAGRDQPADRAALAASTTSP